MASQPSSQHFPSDENDDGEKTEISLKEMLEHHEEETETVAAVLGASDECNCSYDSGYVFRQALYGCKTCLNECKSKASSNIEEEQLLHGICLACSYECHANHELYELYTKRSFRCDCGNARFTNGNVCKLRANKDPTNPLNSYNHNFEGLYCVCNQPYHLTSSSASQPPPPSVPPSTPTALSSSSASDILAAATSNSSSLAMSSGDDAAMADEMVQCVICEDWFHLGHLKDIELYRTPNGESIDDYEDMVCHLCMMNRTDFLWYYQGSNPLESLDVNIVDINPDQNIASTSSASASSSSNNTECILTALKAKNEASIRSRFSNRQDGCVCFLKPKWRRCLCKCAQCMIMYKERKCEYLTNEQDSIAYYEERGKTLIADAENKIMSEHFGKLNRVSQIDLVRNFNDFKEELAQFFAKFARDGKVVKRENVVEFFDELNDKRKRRRLDEENSIGNNYFCK